MDAATVVLCSLGMYAAFVMAYFCSLRGLLRNFENMTSIIRKDLLGMQDTCMVHSPLDIYSTSRYRFAIRTQSLLEI